MTHSDASIGQFQKWKLFGVFSVFTGVKLLLMRFKYLMSVHFMSFSASE